MKKLLLALILLPILAFAQEDLLAGLDSTATKQKVIAAFKGNKIVNLESTKIAAKGDLYFIVAHRFASIKTGFEGFWGLDNANSQIKFLYGINDYVAVSAARSELAYDFAVKYKLADQIEDGFPVAIVGFNSLAFNNALKQSNYPKMTFRNRMVYVTQLLISRKFSERFSFEIAPTFFHENFVEDDQQNNSQYAIAAGGRYKLNKRFALTMDYAAHLNRVASSTYKNPFSIGVDIETGGHVFQLHFTSSQGIHEAGYLGKSTGDWTTGDIYFGFNLARVF
jgi:hypothetical protein